MYYASICFILHFYGIILKLLLIKEAGTSPSKVWFPDSTAVVSEIILVSSDCPGGADSCCYFFLEKNGIKKTQKNISSELLASFGRQLMEGKVLGGGRP